jgi:hypothetical protein
LQGSAAFCFVVGEFQRFAGFIIQDIEYVYAGDFAGVDAVDASGNADRLFSVGKFQRLIDCNRVGLAVL